MPFWNPFRTKKSSVVAILDIGSTQVGGALVSVSPNKDGRKKSQILFHTKSDAGIEGELNYERFNHEITKAIKKVTHELITRGFNQPDKFICFLASPFLISQTKVINYSQEDKLVFTPKMLENISRREAEEFKMLNGGSEFQLIENKIMQIKLDGYEMDSPFEHKANQITISQFLSGSTTTQLNKIRDAVSSQCQNDKIEFHSFAFAEFSSLRDINHNEKNFLIIDVGGEMTDVSVCTDGILLESLSFPYGIHSIEKDMAKHQNSFKMEASSQLYLYLENKLHDRADTFFRASLEKCRTKWTEYFKEVLTVIQQTSVITDQIILTGDTRADKIFRDWLEALEFSKFLFADGSFKVSYLNHKRLHNVMGDNKTTRDTYLLLESMFLEKLIN